ncbi:MAG: hypothetical protein DRJ37_05720, partial [Thermoprotei archaeon]
MIDAICFDLGNTLVRELKEDRALRSDGAKSLYDELGVKDKGIEYEDFIKIHDKVWAEEERVRLKFREISVERIITRILKELDMEYSNIKRLINVYFSPKLRYVKLFPDVPQVLGELKKE